MRIERYREDGRAEGRIVQVLERAASTVVGRYEVDASGLGFVAPFDKRLTADIVIPRNETRDAEPGQMVTVEVTRWPTPTRGPAGRIVEVLGDINDPGVDTEIILRKHGIPDEHPPEAVDEARRIGSAVKENDIAGRTDFRDRKVVTIDGEHARDFDDAISIEQLKNGHYWLGVHIADVAHYVHEGGALDTEAYERGTSVYFPERAVHMFPEALATGLCSLKPHVDRLVQSCLMEVTARGDVVRYEMHDGVIRSDERMTYTAVNAILTDRDPETIAKYRELVPMFELMRELFEILNDRRHRRGSVDFDLPEAQVVLDEDGFIEDIVASERNVAHRLIEEFMLLANETVAGHLESKGMPALYRIHEPPDPLKVLQFEEFVSAFGYSLGARRELGARRCTSRSWSTKIRGTPEERPIAFLMLRTMQKARYDPMNVGHFGLAAPTYTHFTSPIRRYPDLVVHRLLRELRHHQGHRRAAGGARRGPAGGRPPHVRDGAARRRGRARDPAVEEGPLHGRQGRRRLRGLHHRRRAVRLVRRADRALRRRPGARLHDGRRLLPLPRAAARAVWREHQEDLSARRSGHACRSSASTWSGGRSISASRTSSRRCGATNGRAARHAARRGRRRSSARARRRSGAASASSGSARTNARKAHSEASQKCSSIVVGTAGHIDHGKSSLVHGADRDRSRSPEGRESPRHHHRARLRAHHHRRRPASPSSTCPATSGSSGRCSPASAASTACC